MLVMLSQLLEMGKGNENKQYTVQFSSVNMPKRNM